jgi:ubiquinone/menaquinone biosynthesis C-methylase UbiE
MSRKSEKRTSYSILASIYDEVMTDVDYETWTDYIDEIILQYHPEAVDVLELACGTGTMALSLEELAAYNIVATDGSEQMIQVARQKAEKAGSKVAFSVQNFLDLKLDRSFDVIYMVFDSLNYLHTEEEIIELHRQVRSVLKPGGIFIYDFTTPRNSRVAIKFLNNESRKVNDHYRYFRKSSYNAKSREHTNKFIIEELNSESGEPVQLFVEEHRQKIYTLPEIESAVKKTDFTILNAFDGFALTPAHDKSLRITLVLQ